MSAETIKTPPDKIGKFQCEKCGNCCRQPGYVHISDKEIDVCAEFMDIDTAEFIAKYTRLTKQRSGLSLTEQNNGACIFLTEDDKCLINSVKPNQCRQFPFTWRYKDGQDICTGWQNI